MALAEDCHKYYLHRNTCGMEGIQKEILNQRITAKNEKGNKTKELKIVKYGMAYLQWSKNWSIHFTEGLSYKSSLLRLKWHIMSRHKHLPFTMRRS